MNFRRKSIFLLALLLMGGMASAQVTIHGSVYGGGEGLDTIVRAGWVTGNTSVTMNGGVVERSIYGGGQLGSVGTYTAYDTIQVPDTNGVMVKVPVPKSNSRVAGTGLAKVVMRGGFLGGRGSLMPDSQSNPDDDDRGWIFCGSRGEADSIKYPRAIALGVVDSTYLFVGDTAVVTASVYGGCENGLVLGNTHVVIADSCQIGTGYKGLVGTNHTWDARYPKSMWEAAIAAVRNGDSTAIANAAANFNECDHWPYGYNSQYVIYDIFYGENGYQPANSSAAMGSNGHSFFGNVFGGGSGFYPIAPGIWRRSAGQVNGNTLVEIQGGHILTSVYGGNEVTDVKGKSTVKMSGGTLGVPRTLVNIAANPIPCYLFGGGMGDPRTLFNSWTNVSSTEVDITGGTIFGSIFGGGEEGHVLGNVSLTVRDSIDSSSGTAAVVSSPHIGTWGYSYVDGNVFGAGRGFSGTTLTAGGVGGNTEVNIEGGTMLGSIYGGGRLASVGAKFVAPQIDDPSNPGSMIDNPAYGQLQEGDDHGFTTVNIKGGIIGNTFEIEADSLGNYLGGNVFGGSMGRMTLLNGSPNSNWENLAKVKQTMVHINETTADTLVIKGHVYGGGEIGCVEENTLVDIDKGTIGAEVTVGGVEHRLGGNVYGGGKGTPIAEKAGLVKGNAYVDMSNGNVHRSIYGGGEFASVGTFEYYGENPPADHFVGEPKVCEPGTGLASVIVSGGQVGLSHALMPTPGTAAVDDDFGYIFAGGRGTNDPVAYEKANILAVVDSTYLEISDSTYLDSNIPADRTLINASIYGGCENGLVLRDTKVLITGGQIGNGCKKTNPSDPTTWTWDGVYAENKWDEVINAIKADNPNVNNIISLVDGFNECDAWPFGNTSGQYLVYDIFADSTGYDSQGGSLNATDGNSFFGNVFGGGSGYYPYKPGLWCRTAGRVYGNTNVEIKGGHILTAVFGAGEIADVMGTSSVKMTGGTVGVPQTEAEIAGHPLNSHVFGGGKGDSRQRFNEWTNANYTNVEIMGGVVFGSVFGGGEDGHVLNNTAVIVRDSLDGTSIKSSPLVGTWGKTTFDGNVFGGGRGLSTNSPTVGGVVGNTNLTMEGGLVLGSVYGGGRMAAVGVNLTTGALYDDDNHGKTNVTVSGGTVGNAYETDANTNGHMVGGNVYGASRGGLFLVDGTTLNPDWASIAKVRNTDVNIAQANDIIPTLIKGNVYGGGEISQVTKNTDVDMTGGTVGTIQYAWKPSTTDHSQGMDTLYHITGGNVYGGGHGNDGKRDAAWVMNNSTVAMGGGQVWFNVYGGGEMASVGQRTITYDTTDPTKITAIEPVANTGLASVTVTGGQVGPGPKVETGYKLPIGLNSLDGYVFGGGKGIGNDPMTPANPNGRYFDLADVNYTNVTVNIPATADTTTNRIWGSVFGGSEDGHVLDSTTVTYLSGFTGTKGTTSYDGNIFGGGRNYSGKNYVAGRVQGNTHIEMEGGQIYGNIYGGGRLALTGVDFARTQLDGDHGRTMVLVKGGTVGNNTETGVTNPDGSKELLIETFSDHSMGNVYGGGMGNVKGLTAAGHPAASALLVGMVKNTVVEVSEEDSNNPTHIYGIVFGGGEIANVGKYTWGASGTNIEISEGLAKVKIKGGTIGADRAKMRCDLADPSDPDNFWTKYNDDLGYVYGGGEGIVDDPEAKFNGVDVYPYVSIKLDGVTSEQRIIDLMATVNNTEVEVSGGWVKASVFGGAEAGHVMHNTKVTISGGQIGAGDDGTDDLRYTDESVFINPVNTSITNSLHGTAHWPYGSNYGGSTHYDPFDLVLLKQGITPSDGKSWFGNVFGGGSGWFPYVKKNAAGEYQCYWNPLSGQVWGNSEVIITGGHILNNVYGANEFTNVIGSASITMTGGTVGVPRTKDDILAQPTICYVFGGGCGDPRTVFDNNTNVASTDVKIQGGIVYGSVFGGSEDGHVLGNAVTTIEQADGKTTVIGSRGTSGADGNIFGGGRNFLQVNKAAGRVGGSNTVNITGGTMLGSVFGGGRYAQTGVGIDGEYTYDSSNPNKGKATVNISGGQIGNAANDADYSALLYESNQSLGDVFGSGKGDKETYEKLWSGCVANSVVNITGSPRIYGSVWGGGELASIGYHDATTGAYLTNNGAAVVTISGGTIGTEYEFTKAHMDHDPAPVWTSYETHNGVKRVGHTCSGNVMGGCRGEADVTKPHWISLARSRTATVTINDGTIMGNVFGGPEQGTMAGDAHVIINGGTIGRQNLVASDNTTYSFGSVFGGGYGSEDLTVHPNDSCTSTRNVLAADVSGRVYGNSTVEQTGGQVYGNVYGGGEVASVGYYTYTYNSSNEVTDVAISSGGTATVTMTGGKVGPLDNTGLNAYVFGGPKGGQIGAMKPYCNVNTASVTVDMPINDNNWVYGSLFGGGSDGHVLGDATVTINNGYIGTSGTTTWDGNIFGGGRNYFATSYSAGRVGGNTTVNVNGGTMLGSIFGGGRLGNVGADINGDTIAGRDHGYTFVNVGVRTQHVNAITIGHQATSSEDRIGGNVYGGGKGLPGDPTSIYPGLAKVKQTEVNIDQKEGKQTFVEGSVFGGGEDGHVLIDTYVNVKDGQIGGDSYDLTNPTQCTDLYHGNVYGGGRGLDTYTGTDGQQHYSPTAGKVGRNTYVMITGGRVCRNVYGGGNLASVGNAEEQPDVNGNYHTGWANVTLTENAYVGITPNSSNRNGMVFGAGKGMAGETYKDLSMVKNTKVIITGNSKVTGTVYGSGEDGHTRRRTDVLIGDATVNGSTVDGHEVVIGTNGEPGVDGNVYGGGRGLDTYTGIDGQQHYSSTAGITGISTNIEINDGLVKGSVFGGGRLASVGYEAVLDALDNGNIVLDNIPTDYGRATVHITGDATIGAGSYDNGHVFGSGRGNIGAEFKDLAYVHWTDVTVDGNAQVYGSVFGGGMDGHVKKYTPKGHTDVTKFGDTHVTIGALTPGTDVCNIATDATTSQFKGNVYGGGRGFDVDPTGTHSPTAGRVEGNTKVDILSGNVWRHVFGGGNQAVVMGRRVVNIWNGDVHEDVHGGSNAIPSNDAAWDHSGLKTVNVRGGHIYGSVYGCSNTSNDGEVDQTTENAKKWTSFVNINGGQIDGSVHGAGYAGTVNGSVCVNIGANAILNAPNKDFNIDYNKAHTGLWTDTDPAVEPTAKTLVIGGSVYGGSDYYGSTPTNDWSRYDVTGYALIFIDGTGYNTASNSDNYMNIGGGLFGSGTHTESGALGRHILLRNYGTRDTEQMTSASRTLTTIQRANNVIIDHANVKLSGLADISNTANPNKYGVMRVSDTLAVINAGGIVLGSATAGGYAHMDSIYTVQSLNFANSSASIYDHNLNELDKHSWYWVGINKESNPAKLYNISGTGDEATLGSELTFDKENVVIYNDTSKLWVRYHANSKQYYGELLGFFRMKGEYYIPTQKERESFAYARPKISQEPGITEDNKADGGWLSYKEDYNYFTDEGNIFTKTIQYPYINVLEYSKGDRKEYRMWVDPQQGNRWYVDGVRGWGQDKLKSQDPQAGRYPDKPKKTLFGSITDGGVTKKSGIISEAYPVDLYSYKDHLIYVVGALSAEDEAILVRDTTLTEEGVTTRYPLKLYRYPGGHPMSNDSIDFGGGKTPRWGVPSGTSVGYKPSHAGPGANYGAMLDVQANAQVNLRGVELDGLYGYDDDEKELHMIPTTYAADSINFHPEQVTMPLVVTGKNSELGLKQFTVLKRGYNSTNANVWYTDSDYTPYNGSGDVTAYHGGALFVDSLATVSLFGTDSITIVDNMQYLKIGNADATAIESNVYLPTFRTSLRISEQLDDDTHIGITSPKRNDKPSYKQNTLSPVAYTLNGNHAYANAAYTNENFYDDLDWFFVNENKTTYYDPYIDEGKFNDTLYFGWTWANVVRSKPDSYVESTTGGRITVEDERGLAWLISKSAGMNGETATNFAGDTINQIGDANLKQYVWVPIGTDSHPFSGKYDGNGHLITDLDIDYIGKLDKIYQRSYYGMFGKVSNDTINRTFVVSGYIHPVNSVLTDMDTTFIGGLVGYLDGVKAVISNSEAADTIDCPNYPTDHKVVAGGLVARMNNGHIHSSMTMPLVKVGNLSEGKVGGLVGMSKAGTIYNSFVNGSFIVSTSNGNVKVGGLLGDNTNATMRNCYMALREIEGLTDNGLTTTNFGSIAVSNSSSASNIDSCYVMQSNFNFTLSNSCDASCSKYTPVIGADNLGYMWADNKVEGISSKTDTTLFQVLNKSVKYNNRNGVVYARWARAGIPEINDDLPVLMLSEFDKGMDRYQGGFRSVGTYAGSPSLQYGGPTRDPKVGSADNELDAALTRPQVNTERKDCLFVYGDVNSVGVSNAADITQGKVSIYEHASIKSVGALAQFENTYVGVTFDNSYGNAHSTPGMNYGLYGMGGYLLPRDWHMFSSPLKDAPQGFDYKGHNQDTYTSGDFNSGAHFNNPWVYNDDEHEFLWLQSNGSTNIRYWMYGWDNSQSQALNQSLNSSTWQDGYFPSSVSNLHTIGGNCIPGTDEYGRYPYGMDFYTWYEPQYHWINFKRNGPNHWHSDENESTRHHDHLDYYGDGVNVNEEKLITGRGYMAAISVPTFMQSHGTMNNNSNGIGLTMDGTYCTGWNLVGNPYHGYLDFDKFANTNESYLVQMDTSSTDTPKTSPFYLIYDADRYEEGQEGTGFLYYPRGGSQNGAYANRYLHPHQGFFVLAQGTGPLSFTSDMVATRDEVKQDSLFRDWQPNYPLVNLYLSSDKGCNDVTVIEFERPEWGGATKLRELRQGNGLFYGYHEGHRYAALFTKVGTPRVPLWFEAKEDDIYTIKWNTANGDFSSLYLIDNLTGVQYDMLANDTYVFEGHKEDYYSRFYIVFDVTGVDEYEGDDNFVFFDGSQWVVTGDGDLDFIDMQGRELWKGRVSGQSRVSMPKVAAGVYLFRLVNSKNVKIQKVIVEKH